MECHIRDEYPKISVIVIIYGVAPFLPRCLSSLAKQTYPNLEIILVVGQRQGEDDGCLRIAERFASVCPNAKIVRITAAGAGDARNRGLAAATGEYIGFVDGDDWVSPDMFSRLYQNLVSTSAEISVCGKYSEYPGESVPDEAPWSLTSMDPEGAFSIILRGSGFYFHSWDKLFKAELFNGIRFPIDRALEDRYVIWQLLDRAKRIAYDRTPLYHFRVRSDSLSKGDEMADLNTEADSEFVGFVEEKYPVLSKEGEAYLIYSHLTCIQNALLSSKKTSKGITGYFKALRRTKAGNFRYIREHRKTALINPFVGRNTKIKIVLSQYFLPGLLIITKINRKRAEKAHGKYHI